MSKWQKPDKSGKTFKQPFFDNKIDESTKRALILKKFLTTQEAAIYLGTTPSAIRNRVYRRQLYPNRFFGRLMFRRADLDRLIETSNHRRF